MTPRVALFTDCFHEVNGVALTCRQLHAFAERRGLPLLTVHAGERTEWSGGGERGLSARGGRGPEPCLRCAKDFGIAAFRT